MTTKRKKKPAKKPQPLPAVADVPEQIHAKLLWSHQGGYKEASWPTWRSDKPFLAIPVENFSGILDQMVSAVVRMPGWQIGGGDHSLRDLLEIGLKAIGVSKDRLPPIGGYEMIRLRENEEEANLIQELRQTPDRDLLVLAVNRFHFDKFRRELGPRNGRIQHISRGRDFCACSSRFYRLVKLPGWEAAFENMPWPDRRELKEAIYYFEQR